MTAYDAAIRLRRCSVCGAEFRAYRRSTCSPKCYLEKVETQGNEAKRRRNYNDFLPPEAVENLTGTWAPSPEEIAAACVELQEQHYLQRRAEP